MITDKAPPFEAQASRELPKEERALVKLEQAVSGTASVSKNVLIREAIRILKA